MPTSWKEMKQLGWNQADVLFFTGDAYIDHPSFGTAIIARILQDIGLTVAIIPQPNWRDDLRDFKKLGKPRLFFAVSGGNMDSMVNHYTAAKRLRSDDMFTPGGRSGSRPDYAVTVYSTILKDLYPDVPVVLGGIEASLRRLSHYDYWSDSVKPSVLIDSKADLLVYGMGEKPIQQIAKQLLEGKSIHALTDIPQTAFTVNTTDFPLPEAFSRNIRLEPFVKSSVSKIDFAKNFKRIEEESNRKDTARLEEVYPDKMVVVNPPFSTYTQSEIDYPYTLPYTRLPHPRYFGKETIPAFEMIRDSVNIHRGCFGGCSFCTISAHQGKDILSRSEESILEELKKVVETPGFHGHITDLGGPSANMYQMKGKDLKICDSCRRPSCIFPTMCKNLQNDHRSLSELYKKARLQTGIKKITIGSGIRYDLIYGSKDSLMKNYGKNYLADLIKNHVSGRLKVAPEHTAPQVLTVMRKPSFDMFLQLKADFDSLCRRNGLTQQIIPYLISSHPGSRPEDMAEMAATLRNLGLHPEQVQDFTPTPMTLSSAIYYTGIDPYTLKPIYTAHSPEEKKDQQRFFFYYKKENYFPISSNC